MTLRDTTKNLIVIVVSCVVFGIGMEILFRIITPKSPKGTTYGVEVQRNEDGFRDRTFAVPKPKSVYRIVVLGDSFTWGVGLASEDALPKILERELRARYSYGKAVEVLNAARPGYNTVQQLGLLKQTALKYEPDLLLLIYNLNDIEYLPELATRHHEGEAVEVVELDAGEEITDFWNRNNARDWLLSGERRSKFLAFLVPRVGHLLRTAGLLDNAEFSWAQRIFQGYHDENPGWLESKYALAEVAGICRGRGIPMLVAIYPLLLELDDYQGREAHATIVRYCDTLDVTAVDLLPVFLDKSARSFWINFMDAHPNQEAHRLVAERLLPALVAAMDSAGVVP